MKKIVSILLIIISCQVAFSQHFSANKTNINYNVSFPEALNHYADIEMSIDDITENFIDVKMPVWIPGSYLVREFSKNVEQFSAKSGTDKEIKTEKINKNTWRIYNNENKNIKIKYKVYCFEISVRTSFIDASHAFLSCTSIFMYPAKRNQEASTIKINLAHGWDKISTGLRSMGNNTFFAPDYDWLYDSPIEVGNQDIFSFTAAGIPHDVAMYGGGNYDKEKLTKDMTKVIEELTSIFNENPNKHYTFIVHNYDNYGGGLEHLNSTVLGASRLKYGTEAGHLGFINLVAHEYFHLWNVKRLRPIALGPFNYDEENYTTNLWIAEGFTSYFDNLVMRHAGFHNQDKYIDNLANSFSGIDNTPGNKIQSVSESSLDAWIKYYRPNENSRNSTISYYSKGEVIAACIDLIIINATKGEKSLKDVMKYMYDTYYKKENRGYTDAEFKAGIEKIGGVNMDDFYSKYINGTTAIPYQDYLNFAGLTITDLNKENKDVSLSISTSNSGDKTTIKYVARDGSGWNAGLNVNDIIKTIDGKPADSLNSVVSSKKIGDILNFVIERDGIEKTISVKLQRNPSIKYVITRNKKPTDLQKKVLKVWLKD